MKNLSNLFIFCLLSTLLLSSCQISHKSASIGVEDIKKSGFVMAKPLVSEIDVENVKVEGRAVISNKLYQASSGGVNGAAMNLAVIDAVKKAGCDIIVQPVYELENSGTYTTATVRGFAGRYKNFREITVADTAAFHTRYRLDHTSAVRQRENNIEVQSGGVVPKKKSGGKAIGGLVALLVLLALLPALSSN